MPVMANRVTVVDERGRTVCKFSKRTYLDDQMRRERTESWAAQAKQTSEKAFRREGPLSPRSPGRLEQLPTNTFDGQKYLELPGLTLKWEKIVPFLDRIALSLGLIDASGAVLKDDLMAVNGLAVPGAGAWPAHCPHRFRAESSTAGCRRRTGV